MSGNHNRRSSNATLPVVSSDLRKDGDQEDQEGKANQLESTVNMVNGILGAGLLGMPFAFKSCGVILGLLLLSLCLYTSRMSLNMLAQLGHATGLRSYEDLAQLAFGRTGTYAVNVCVILLNIGNIIAYMNIFVDTVLWFGKGWLFQDFEEAKNTLLTLTVFLGMLPVGLSITSGKHMASLAFFAVTIYTFFCAYMTVKGLQSFLDANTSGSAAGAAAADAGSEALVLWRMKGLIVAFPIMFYSFTAHTVIFPIYHNLKSPSLANIKSVTASALSIVFTVYIVVGSAGYLMFRHLVRGDVLTNLGQEGGSAASVDDLIKFFYGSTSLATVPILLLPIKSCVFSVPFVKHLNRNSPLKMNKRGTLHCTIAVVTLFLALICATLIPNIEYVFRLTGGSTCVTLGCILPSLIYLKLHSQVRGNARTNRKVSRRTLTALAVFGVLSGIICTWSAVVDVDKAPFQDSAIRHHQHHHHHAAAVIRNGGNGGSFQEPRITNEARRREEPVLIGDPAVDLHKEILLSKKEGPEKDPGATDDDDDDDDVLAEARPGPTEEEGMGDLLVEDGGDNDDGDGRVETGEIGDAVETDAAEGGLDLDRDPILGLGGDEATNGSGSESAEQEVSERASV